MATSPVAQIKRVFVFASIAACAVACQGQVSATGDSVTLGGGDDGTAWWQGDGVIGGSGADDGTDQGSGPKPEICDGLDNDLDGQTDEGTDGQACTGSGGGAGTQHCVSGKLVCHECTPGTTRSRSCGCGVDTKDTCNDSGRWVTGLCDACNDLTTEACGVDAACQPGDERVQRCDTCPAGQDCGSSCVGALFRCSAGCKWEQVGACSVRAPVCDRDTVRVEECGKCGRHDVTCDGCFFVEGPCHDQGACMPGETRDTPCFENACTSGFVATAHCNDQCSWEPGSCDGCAPGPAQNVDILCIADHPECGKRVEQHQCIGTHPVDSCQADPLIEGVYTTTTISDECDNVVQPNYCPPNQVTSETHSCGANSCGLTYTVSHHCLGNGCGSYDTWSGSCGSCTTGQTDTRDCTTSNGGCGSQSRSCASGCDWGAWSTCTAKANTCQVGAQETRSCTAACNKPGTSVWQCAGGCGGWQQITECESNQAQCNPGDVQDLGPCPHCQSTHQTKTCDSQSCSWVTSTCPICD